MSHKPRSSLAMNMFVCSVISIIVLGSACVADTIPSLAMNAFVCGVMSYLEESSREYLVDSDEQVRLWCDVVFGGYPGFPRLAR